MTIDTWALVGATILGPVFAVQVERYLARRREFGVRQTRVFQVLMATRISTLSREHVDALNAVPVEFFKDARVMEKWRAYLAHLNHSPASDAGWGVRRVDLYTDMLAAMSQKLNYPFEPLQIKNDVYSPIGHARLEDDETTIRAGLVALFKGERPLPLDVKSMAQDENVLAAMVAAQKAMTDWLTGKTVARVTVVDPESPPA